MHRRRIIINLHVPKLLCLLYTVVVGLLYSIELIIQYWSLRRYQVVTLSVQKLALLISLRCVCCGRLRDVLAKTLRSTQQFPAALPLANNNCLTVSSAYTRAGSKYDIRQCNFMLLLFRHGRIDGQKSNKLRRRCHVVASNSA